MTRRERAATELRALDAQGLRRFVRDFDGAGPTGVLDDGRPVVVFASNDYLGLSAHPEVVAAARSALERWGTGAGAARLITGSRPVHTQLEHAIAEWKESERALLFSTGYAANLGVLSVLGDDARTLIASDELNHASIVDGCRLARARAAVYAHGSADAMEALISSTAGAVCVTDAVFSMDGDLAPIPALDDACRRHGAMLVTDEAHCVFALEEGVPRAERVRVGTLSKFLGSVGGFVAGRAEIIELLINRARPFIFTTAGSPADAAAGLAALHVYRSPEGARLRRRLRAHIDRIAPDHPSPVVPVVVGDERAALAASEALLARGYLVPAVRPPSVPRGSARLRVTLSAAHTDEHVEGLAAALDELGLRARPALASRA